MHPHETRSFFGTALYQVIASLEDSIGAKVFYNIGAWREHGRLYLLHFLFTKLDHPAPDGEPLFVSEELYTLPCSMADHLDILVDMCNSLESKVLALGYTKPSTP